MRGRVLVLGANGFIGSHVAAALSAEGWRVRAGARRIAEPSRRAPGFDWVAADFSKLTTAQAWAPLLEGVSAVVNCVGVLQDGGGDSTRCRPSVLSLAALCSGQTLSTVSFTYGESVRHAGTDHVSSGTFSLAGDSCMREILVTDNLVQAGGIIKLTQAQPGAKIPVLRLQLLHIHTRRVNVILCARRGQQRGALVDYSVYTERAERQRFATVFPRCWCCWR